MKRICTFLWVISALSFAAPHRFSDLSRTCEIQISEKHHNGAKAQYGFTTLLNSRAECYELAKLHRSALVSQRVKARKVYYEWARARKLLSRHPVIIKRQALKMRPNSVKLKPKRRY